MTLVVTSMHTEPEPPKPWTQRCALLVEGRDDLHLLAAILRQSNVASTYRVHNLGGKNKKWAARVEAILDDRDFAANGRIVALLQDADDDPASAFASCANALESAGFLRPYGPGEIVAHSSRSIRGTTYILPGLDGRGAVEELLLAGCPPERHAVVRDFVDAAEKIAPLKRRTKAQLWSHLAIAPDGPATNVYVGVEKHLFDEPSEQMAALADFIQRLDEAATDN